MRKRSLVLWLITVLALTALLMGGCGEKSNNSTTAPTTAANSSAPASQTPTSSSTTSPASPTAVQTSTTAAPSSSVPNTTLSEILKKADSIPSVAYESVMTSSGAPPVTQKIWAKKTKMRVETTVQGINSVTFIDLEKLTAYNYMPAQNMAIKMDFSQVSSSVHEDTDTVMSYNPKVVGSETINGKPCLIIEFKNDQGTSKQWLWEENGFPLRIEVTTTAGNVVIESQNIDFSDIPDNMFELPAGVQITDIGQFKIPTNLPTDIPGLPTGIPGMN
jgi:outer membrane lipoprotein-sorting protein